MDDPEVQHTGWTFVSEEARTQAYITRSQHLNDFRPVRGYESNVFFICPICTASVTDPDKHLTQHEKLDALARLYGRAMARIVELERKA